MSGEANQYLTLTSVQKLNALAHRFYQDSAWEPKAGDYYTTSRADLELYQVVDVRDGKVFTRYCDPIKSVVVTDWPAEEFLSPETFGRCRVHVPTWIFATYPAPEWHAGEHSPLPYSVGAEESDTGSGKVTVTVLKDATGKTILDPHNSDVMLIMEECDEDGRRQWDEQSRLDCAFIVEACNAYGRTMLGKDANAAPAESAAYTARHGGRPNARAAQANAI